MGQNESQQMAKMRPTTGHKWAWVLNNTTKAKNWANYGPRKSQQWAEIIGPTIGQQKDQK
jgi:hypothetical protein